MTLILNFTSRTIVPLYIVTCCTKNKHNSCLTENVMEKACYVDCNVAHK